MWLSLICTKLKPESAFAWSVPPDAAAPVAANSLDMGTPPTIVHRSPVPAQAMQLRKLRRSIPSFAVGLGFAVSAWSVDDTCGFAGTGLFAFFIEKSSTDGNWDRCALFLDEGINLPA